MASKGITLKEYILADEGTPSSAAGEFSTLLNQVGHVSKIIAHETRGAGLGNLLGATGERNVHGEAVKRMDEFANQAFVDAFGAGALVCTLVSEEMEKPLHFQENCPQGKYTLFIDPLDGSSNFDINGSVGTIFSIHHRQNGAQHGTDEELLRTGSDQVVAGYVLYGPSTLMVYTTGRGVHGFTLDPAQGEFLLTNENIHIPVRGKTFSVNEGNYNRWHPKTRQLIAHLKENDSSSGRPYSARYVGALVADFHRILLEGGIYLYPGELKKPEGKLRLMYEAAPLALLAEQAGGRASNGLERILDIRPKDIHQRVPLVIGSPEDVALADAFISGRKKNGS